ncbi:hypothetical protein HYH03_011626 [Edaphochlamys debaryana]|uniref:Uncharacterized protein n=1 Tax=Edaphochlamys debaryana TaxID=47281 RepID=A0A835XVV1_9CHLO|nr:hypothetical protein HYH03_011626 [Edaphochlamys debaryana]|eukprot:KAG2489998.1 hypothetical protein HYH03_011626 [Edaphochlamys debaryana]
MYPSELPRFGTVALEAIADALASLGRPVRVCGLSGLTVTKAGVSLFTSLYGCRERSFVCHEHILQDPSTGALEVHEADDPMQLQALLHRGLSYVVRVRMLMVTPDEPSLVWLTLPAAGTPLAHHAAGAAA